MSSCPHQTGERRRRGLRETTHRLCWPGSEWRQYAETFPLLAKSHIDQGSFECANSRVPIELLGLPAGKQVPVGVVDVATNAVETPENVAATIRKAMAFVPAERLFSSTNFGMVPLARRVAREAARARRGRRARAPATRCLGFLTCAEKGGVSCAD